MASRAFRQARSDEQCGQRPACPFPTHALSSKAARPSGSVGAVWRINPSARPSPSRNVRPRNGTASSGGMALSSDAMNALTARSRACCRVVRAGMMSPVIRGFAPAGHYTLRKARPTWGAPRLLLLSVSCP